jgi:lipopolysaccharide transport system permease protein
MTTQPSVLVIEAGRTERHYWRDLWRYRELFFFLAWRDILVRYKQTVIGILWALGRPLLTMLVFTLVFSKLAKLPSEGAPYPILVFAALLPWQFFANAFSGAGESLISNAGMISKVYFPRLVIPASAVIVSFADFLISGIILAGLMVWYGFEPGLRMLTLPLFILVAFAAAMGAGLWIAALNVKYRDFRYIVPFVEQQHSPGTLAVAVFDQPYGGGDRRLPLGDPGRQHPAVLARILALHFTGSGDTGHRDLLLP